MTVAEAPTTVTEDERVAGWRLEQLLRAGYESTDAFLLAALPHVDLHRAVDLLATGCPADTALRIVL